MTKYRFTARATCSIYTDVEAETADEARAIAEERGEIELDPQGSSERQDEAWILDDPDGTPQEIKLQDEVDE